MADIDKLAWIQIENQQLLSARSYGKATFYVPGGKRDVGESGDTEALLREVQEELSVSLEPASLRYMETFTAQADGKANGIRVRVTCYTASYAGVIQAAAEIEEVRWLGYADRTLCSSVTQMILDWLWERGLVK